MKKISIGIVAMFLATMGLAQYQSFPSLIIKNCASCWLHIKIPAAQFAVEYPLIEQITLEQEVGYVFYDNTIFQNRKGFRFRNNVRFYTQPFEYWGRNHYFSLQFRFWKFSATMERDFNRFNGAFQQRIAFTARQTAWGGGVGYGRRIVWIGNFVIDAQATLGLQHVYTNPIGVPPDAEEERFFFQTIYSEKNTRELPYLTFTIYMGWAFK